MEAIFKTYLSIILMLLVVFLGIGVVSASVSARTAESMITNSEQAIENSYFAESVIKSCVRSYADTYGVANTVTKKTTGNSTTYKSSDGNYVVTVIQNGDEKYGSISIDYVYVVPFSTASAHTITVNMR